MTAPAIDEALRAQGQVVEALRARDRERAAFSMADARNTTWSPVTLAAERVLYVLQRVAAQARDER